MHGSIYLHAKTMPISGTVYFIPLRVPFFRLFEKGTPPFFSQLMQS